MRTLLSFAGMTLLAAGGLVVAGDPRPQAPAPAAAAAASTTAPAQEKPKAAPAANPEEEAVRELLRGFVKAHNATDARAMADLFVDDGAVIDSEGATTRGHDALAAMYAVAMEEAPGLTLEGQAESVRFLTPDVAQVEGQARLSGGGAGDAVERTRFAVLAVKRDGKWRLIEVRDYPTPPVDITSHERLRELEWMVGDWVDQSENARVTASIRWADNDSFLVRTYNVEIPGEEPKSGTMFIGWDPQTGQIKSWVFDSEGGHGEGLWTRTAENQWVVKAHGVIRDGRPNSATLIHTVVNHDAVKTASVDRIIGGIIAPDVPEIIMVRQPPEPAVPADKPAAPEAGK